MTGLKLKKNILRKFILSISLLGLWASLCAPVMAEGDATKKQPSDKVVKHLMQMTFNMLPDKKAVAEDAKGEVILDKSKAAEIYIPSEDARRIIRRAYLTGKAQACDLRDLQVANYRDMMKTEIASDKWSSKQLFYINQLHLVTVMMQLGNIKVSAEGEKVKPEKSKATCSPAEAARIANFIKKAIGAGKTTVKKDGKKAEKK